MAEIQKIKAQSAKRKAQKSEEHAPVIPSESEESQEVAAGEGAMKGITIQRYKGLGEMNPEQLWETTMDPQKRTLKQVAIADAKEADRIFDILMGEEVAPRKRWLQTHAKNVKNLDI